MTAPFNEFNTFHPIFVKAFAGTNINIHFFLYFLCLKCIVFASLSHPIFILSARLINILDPHPQLCLCYYIFYGILQSTLKGMGKHVYYLGVFIGSGKSKANQNPNQNTMFGSGNFSVRARTEPNH